MIAALTLINMDPRRVIGSIVLAKIIHIMNEPEVGRLYGGQKSTKVVYGVVVEVHNTKDERLEGRKQQLQPTMSLSEEES